MRTQVRKEVGITGDSGVAARRARGTHVPQLESSEQGRRPQTYAQRRRVTAGSRPHPPTILRNASDNMSANVTDTSGARAGGGGDVQSEKPETHLP